MPVQITSNNLELTDSMKVLAEQKLERVLKKIPDGVKKALDIRVVLDKGAAEDTFETKIEILGSNFGLVSKQSSFTLENSIIKAVEEIDRQYIKAKEQREREEWKERRKQKTYQEK